MGGADSLPGASVAGLCVGDGTLLLDAVAAEYASGMGKTMGGRHGANNARATLAFPLPNLAKGNKLHRAYVDYTK